MPFGPLECGTTSLGPPDPSCVLNKNTCNPRTGSSLALFGPSYGDKWLPIPACSHHVAQKPVNFSVPTVKLTPPTNKNAIVNVIITRRSIIVITVTITAIIIITVIIIITIAIIIMLPKTCKSQLLPWKACTMCTLCYGWRVGFVHSKV